MKKSTIYRSIVSVFFIFSAMATADFKTARWTGQDDRVADLKHLVEVVSAKTGVPLTDADFSQFEDRDLAHNHFRMYVQQAGGVPMQGMSIRVWTSLTTGDAIQVEAFVDTPPSRIAQSLLASDRNLSSQATMQIVQDSLANADDNNVRSVDWKDVWENGRLFRIVRVKGKRGTHNLKISLRQKSLSEQSYQQFPQADEFSVPVQIYSIYEQVEKTKELLSRTNSELRYLQAKVPKVTGDPYAPMRNRRYFDYQYDPFLGLTPEGIADGYWAMSALKSQALKIFGALPVSDNSYENGGVILQGRYATVSLHPQVSAKFRGLNFTPGLSPIFKPDWRPATGMPGRQELIPSSALLGQPLASDADAMNRPARKLPDNDTVSLINDGFDEIQVYWSVNQLFDSLRGMGFTDPELSTRRFNAFLYDPDIEYRDNAFYTDDTINFTTYSSASANDARDNSTIWHELGHGVMDRLMGDEIQLADTGGLSEGMADFVAQMVLNDVSNGGDYPGKQDLRIFNHTGFYLTSEVHDDGEAYGGTMNDLLIAAMNRWGRPGLTKVVDLTLETMRFTRNHPRLTAVDWFNHMTFADEVGNSPVREPGELRYLIATALNGRNFSLDGASPALFTVMNGSTEITSTNPGARNRPLKVRIPTTGKTSYHLTVKLKNSPTYAFKFPVTVKVALTGSPLQGSVHWVGKENSPLTYTINSENDTLPIDLTATGKCDAVNKTDGSCVDYAHIQIWNNGETQKPQAKKRFYINIINN